MKITKRQLRRIIKEAGRSLGVDSPLAPFTDEDSEKKDDLLGMYSDAYKYRYNVRPSGDTMKHMFATMTADEIGKEIDKEYDAAHREMAAEEEEQEAAWQRARKEKELKAMQPDPEHREELTKQSGMRRRTEGVLRQVIREAFLPNLPYAPIPMKSRASAIVLDAMGKGDHIRIKEGMHDDLYKRFFDVLVDAPDSVLARRHQTDEVLAYVQSIDSGAVEEFDMLSPQDQTILIERLRSLTDSTSMSNAYYQSGMYSGD